LAPLTWGFLIFLNYSWLLFHSRIIPPLLGLLFPKKGVIIPKRPGLFSQVGIGGFREDFWTRYLLLQK